MPRYDYCCQNCDQVFEVSHGMTETPTVKCKSCRSRKPCQKLISPGIFGTSAGKEVWDYNDVRDSRPKYVKSRDGKTRVRYDSSKHGYGKGTGR